MENLPFWLLYWLCLQNVWTCSAWRWGSRVFLQRLGWGQRQDFVQGWLHEGKFFLMIFFPKDFTKEGEDILKLVADFVAGKELNLVEILLISTDSVETHTAFSASLAPWSCNFYRPSKPVPKLTICVLSGQLDYHIIMFKEKWKYFIYSLNGLE